MTVISIARHSICFFPNLPILYFHGILLFCFIFHFFFKTSLLILFECLIFVLSSVVVLVLSLLIFASDNSPIR